ncbi:MAG: hypothetical protein EPO22_06635 [Dehalococcoidia bacterium]|nr:MAG: hypothetical protein EPO22_06635 [Dehalococcoidia bacterium]
MKFRRSILAAVGGIAVGAALVTFGFAWSASSSHAQTPSTTPTTSAGTTTTPSTGTTPVSTPTRATSPLTPVTTPTGGVSGAQSLPGTGTGPGGDSGPPAVLWIGLAILGAGLVASAVSLTAKRRRS